MSEAARIVFVDDDASFRTIMGRELRRMGFAVELFPSAEGLRDRVAQQPPDAVVLDLRMPGKQGLDVLLELLGDNRSLQVIVLTGHGSVTEAVEAMRRGAIDFLTKPVDLDILEQTVRKAVATTRLLAENRRLRWSAATGGSDPIPLPSEASRRVELEIERIGQAEATTLVQGESGVGKELVARMLHQSSPRSAEAFVSINCAAIPSELVESELFGHRRGAFTGADNRRAGLFESANRGTLFLDEIGELPLEVQPVLLRALQLGEIRPVGSDEVRTVDIRLIAATNQDLHSMVKAGRFREDLFFRLAVLELRVPPLRERRDDIPVLAQRFLAREAGRTDRLLRLTDAAVEALTAEHWPGNIRQLENAMVRVAVLASGPEVDVEEVRGLLEAGKQEIPPPAQLPTLALRDLEQLAIEAALKRHAGNKRRAAEELGIALKTLYNKLNRAGPLE